eukprot:jgi/Botrbrau1/21391/Bobra.0216s0011.1
MDWGPHAMGLGRLAVLDYELLEHILLAPVLTERDLLALSMTSHLLNILSLEEPLWMKYCLRGKRTSLCYLGSWRATALAEKACTRDIQATVDRKPFPLPGFYSDYLYRRWFRCHMSVGDFVPPIVSQLGVCSTLDPNDFDMIYDVPCRPTVLVNAMDTWEARKWSREGLVSSYGNLRFKTTTSFGRDTRMTLRDFMTYADVQTDEEPLYIFDADFGETAPNMLKEYSVPGILQHDLMRVMGHRAPDYRWLILGLREAVPLGT